MGCLFKSIMIILIERGLWILSGFIEVVEEKGVSFFGFLWEIVFIIFIENFFVLSLVVFSLF